MPTHCDRHSIEETVGHELRAPSTLGTFLRSFTFGNLRQLDVLHEQVLRRAWSCGAGPGSSPMIIGIDSTICEVHGKNKQGTGYGYTGVLGYHPLFNPSEHRRDPVHQ